MESFKDDQSCQYEVSESGDEGITLHLQGRMDGSSAARMIEVLSSLLMDRLPASLLVNLEKVTYLDDFGALVLIELKNIMTAETAIFK